MTIKNIDKKFQEIPMDKLVIGKFQVRTKQTDAGIDELATSIEKVGLLEPIVVMPSPDQEGHWEIITGQRRFLACESLGLETISAMVMQASPSPEEALTISLTENMMRRDISEKEYIDACTELFNKYGDVHMVVEQTGLPIRKVNQYIKAPQLSDSLKKQVDSGIPLNLALIANEHSRNDDGTKNEELGLIMVKEMAEEGMGPRAAKQFAKNLEAKARKNNNNQVSEEDIQSSRTKRTVRKRQSFDLSIEVDRALDDYSSDQGSSREHSVAELVSEGLQEKGYLEDD